MHGAFSDCGQLTNVILGEGWEEMEVEPFRECTSLREVGIPHAVEVTKNGAFALCSHLTSVLLGEGLEGIGEQPFAECTSLND